MAELTGKLRYKVSVSWRMWADLEIEADSPEEAEQIAHDGEIPDDGEYCDGSWEIDSDETELLDDEYKDERHTNLLNRRKQKRQN